MRFIVVEIRGEKPHPVTGHMPFRATCAERDVDLVVHAPDFAAAKRHVGRLFTGATFSDEGESTVRGLDNPPEVRADHMTLRDHFAGQALPALISERMYNDTDAARLAYRLADAMLEVRGR